MKQIDENTGKVVFIINNNSQLIGALSDGDIRRWILSGESLNVPVSKLYNHNPIFVNLNTDHEKIRGIMISNKIASIPEIDEKKKIVKIHFWDEFLTDIELKTYEKLNNEVIIMAGGAGTRMEPFTHVLPKPLIPVGEKTIIENIIDNFLNYGINHFYITINHKAKILKSFFEELSPEYNYQFLHETKPLGTIGGIRELKGKIKDSFFVTNCDILIFTDYAEILSFHKSNNYQITLVASLMNHQIPYGICKIDKGGKLLQIIEKPEYNYLVSTGMYVLEKETIDLIPENKIFHITDLIESVKKNGGKVGVYPISENSWADTGNWTEYKKTIQKLSL